jgi:hypothetical protein
MKVYWTAATAVLASVSTLLAQDHKHMLVPSPAEITWSAAPPVLPKDAQAALLWGDPSKEGSVRPAREVPGQLPGPASLPPCG